MKRDSIGEERWGAKIRVLIEKIGKWMDLGNN